MTAESAFGSQRRRFLDRQSGLALLLGKCDDQDAVLGERDQHHEADLGVKIEIQAGILIPMKIQAPGHDRQQNRNRIVQLSYNATRNK